MNIEAKTEAGKRLIRAGLVVYVEGIPFLVVKMLEVDGRRNEMHAIMESGLVNERIKVGEYSGAAMKDDSKLFIKFPSPMLLPITHF